MTTTRRHLLLSGLAFATAGQAAPAAAQSGAAYPTRTVTMVIPYAAGGPADVLARELAQQLAQRLNRTVIVDARAGGATAIGTGYVARAAADGYTLLLGTSAGHVVTPLMQRVPYDGLADFAFIGVVASQPNVLLVHAGTGIDSVAALVARARKEPGALNYASAGNGGATHLGAETFLKTAGIRMTHVPYAGAAPAVNDLLAGHVQMAMLNVAAVKQHIESGKLRALAYGGHERSALLPQVPTLAEAGMKGAELATWYTLAAPRGTPAGIVQSLADALAQIRQQPAWQKFLVGIGAERSDLTPAQTTSFVANDKVAMSRLLGQLNLLDK